MTDVVPFSEVFRDELYWIRKRRDAEESPEPPISTDELPTSLPELQELAISTDLCGLALSGGGIRSATFGLGVLQGMASCSLLPKIDYLSTVSGGGYIGAWYSAWVNRAGHHTVEAGLIPPSMRDSLDPTLPSPLADIEAPLTHLRRYSNYLAPRLGFFSFDGWALITICIRNLVLNQLVLLSAVFGLFLLLRFVVEVFSMAHAPYYALSLTGLGCCTVIELLVACCGVACLAPGGIGQRYLKHRKSKSDPATDGIVSREFAARHTLFDFWRVCVVPWIFATFCCSLIITSPQVIDIWLRESCWPLFAGCVVTFVLLNVVIGYSSLSCRGRSIIPSAFAGVIGGAAFFAGWRLLLQSATVGFAQEHDISVAVISTFGVPLSLLTIVLSMFLMIGFCGSALEELEREWWSGQNSRLMMVAVSWTALASATVFGPWLLTELFINHRAYGNTISTAIGTTWVGILAAGLKAAQGPRTGGSNKRGIREAMAIAAPSLFLVTLLLGMSFISTWLAYEVHADLNDEGNWRFEKRLPDLLTDLNVPKAIELAKVWNGGADGVRNVLDGWEVPGWAVLMISSFGMIGISWLAGGAIGVNTFSLQSMYANRLVRCYLGASNTQRDPNGVAGMDPKDDLEMTRLFPGEEFRQRFGLDSQPTQRIPVDAANFIGPLHIVNGAMNQKPSVDFKSDGVAEVDKNLQYLERKSESFIFSPLYCGSESTGYVPSTEFADNIKLGTAVAVSGAAVSPNMGYHSSPAITALLTAFNIRLGAWFTNPGHAGARSESNPPGMSLYFKEMAGLTNSHSGYVYVSDGGHFENVGIYELVRRRCRFIVAVDSGADPAFQENFGRVVRQVRIDFGIRIDINMKPVTPDSDGRCAAHMVVGRIHYDDASFNHDTSGQRKHQNGRLANMELSDKQGVIVWIKNGLTGDEPADIQNYAAMHPTFPYDTTVDQFFNESQFESYRALGWHSVISGLQPFGVDWKNHSPRKNFKKLYDFFLEKPPEFVPIYVGDNDAYSSIQKTLHQDPLLVKLVNEIYPKTSDQPQAESTPEEARAERLMAIEMFTVLENVWLSLDLDHSWNQPMYKGWMAVFRKWKYSERLQKCWKEIEPEFSPAFRRFIKHAVRNKKQRTRSELPSNDPSHTTTSAGKAENPD